MEKTDKEYNNLTEQEAYKIIIEKRNQILDHFSKAYVAETGLMPSQIELVTKQVSDGTTIENVFYFRKKE